MKSQALFSSKYKSKKLKCRLLQFLFGALMVKKLTRKISNPVDSAYLISGVFLTILLYGYYYGMMDHSGINMDAVWPWQPSSMFHDNHHRYNHTVDWFTLLCQDFCHGNFRLLFMAVSFILTFCSFFCVRNCF